MASDGCAAVAGPGELFLGVERGVVVSCGPSGVQWTWKRTYPPSHPFSPPPSPRVVVHIYSSSTTSATDRHLAWIAVDDHVTRVKFRVLAGFCRVQLATKGRHSGEVKGMGVMGMGVLSFSGDGCAFLSWGLSKLGDPSSSICVN